MAPTAPTTEPARDRAKRVKRSPEAVKDLFMAYFSRGERWPDEVNTELRKYYRRSYISPKGSKHVLYLAWRQEWEQTQQIVYLPGRRVN